MCKEQYIYIETDSTDAAFNFAVEYYLATERPFPVSYTHLDVYKRQLPTRPTKDAASARKSARPSLTMYSTIWMRR